jgi:hypothetical protein
MNSMNYSTDTRYQMCKTSKDFLLAGWQAYSSLIPGRAVGFRSE